MLVLPDMPGERAPANCPGARYGFQVGMICDGILLARELFGENVDYTSYSRKRAAESTSAGASSTPTDEPSPIREGLTSL